MKTFLQWAEAKNYKLPVVSESGSARRAAVRAYAYPELYGRGQYPKSYFRPTAADAVTYQDLEEKGNKVAANAFTTPS